MFVKNNIKRLMNKKTEKENNNKNTHHTTNMYIINTINYIKIYLF